MERTINVSTGCFILCDSISLSEGGKNKKKKFIWARTFATSGEIKVLNTFTTNFLACTVVLGFTNETVKAGVYLVGQKTLLDYRLKTLEVSDL